MRVNLGSGNAYMDGWLNVDSSPEVRADVHLNALDFIRRHGPECDEVYLGHFLEHLMPESAHALLRLIAARCPEGTLVSAVSPDMRAIFSEYLHGVLDNRTLNEAFVYSYVQPSHHVWCYDTPSLVDLFQKAGLEEVRPIDPLTWPPVYWKEGPDSMYQCGVAGTVGSNGTHIAVVDTSAAPSPSPASTTPATGPLSPDAILLERIAQYRRRIEGLEARVRELQLEWEFKVTHNVTLQKRLDALHEQLDALQPSRGRRLTMRAIEALLPPGTRRRRLAKQLRGSVGRRLAPRDGR